MQLFLGVHKSIYNGEFPDENYDIKHSTPGIIGMVKKGNKRHSNECQFYITLTGLESFDGNYVAFGRIVQGFNIIKQIEKIETYLQKPKFKVKVEKSGEYII
jgi:cyclophilin family peptidyl-prolyl cis-trans isomerase